MRVDLFTLLLVLAVIVGIAEIITGKQVSILTAKMIGLCFSFPLFCCDLVCSSSIALNDAYLIPSHLIDD
jgi:hypothetical protein